MHPELPPLVAGAIALRRRLAEAFAEALKLDQETRAAKAGVPAAAALFDQVHRWLADQPASGGKSGGGLMVRLDAAYGGIAPGLDGVFKVPYPCKGNLAGWRAAAPGLKRLEDIVTQARQARDQAARYAVQANPVLRDAVQSLWNRNQKDAASRLDRYRQGLQARLDRLVKNLDKALSMPALGQGYKRIIARTAAECAKPADGLLAGLAGPRALAEGADCDTSLEDKNIKDLEGQLADWQRKLNDPNSDCNYISGGKKVNYPSCLTTIEGLKRTLKYWQTAKADKLSKCQKQKKDPDEKACADNPACARQGPDIPRHRTLRTPEKALVNASLAQLAATTTGKALLDSILRKPAKGKTQRYDLASLRAAGVEVRAAENMEDTARIGYVVKDKRGYYVLYLNWEALAAKSKALAPMLGHELSHAQDFRLGNYGGSRIATEQKAHLNQIYVTAEVAKAAQRAKEAELKRKGKSCRDRADNSAACAEVKRQVKIAGRWPCADQSTLCQDERLSLRIWRDDLRKPENDRDSGEFAHPDIIKGFVLARDEAKASGKRGTDYRLDVVAKQYRGYDDPSKIDSAAKARFLAEMLKRDEDYRRANGYVLPK